MFISETYFKCKSYKCVSDSQTVFDVDLPNSECFLIGSRGRSQHKILFFYEESNQKDGGISLEIPSVCVYVCMYVCVCVCAQDFQTVNTNEFWCEVFKQTDHGRVMWVLSDERLLK